MEASGIAPDVAALNVAPFGPGTDRHWETERAELVAHARLAIQTGSVTSSGHPQGQPGHLADRLIRLDQRYRHLQAGGWRSLSDALPGLPRFDQWKPAQARLRNDRPGEIKYEAPPGFPDGGGLLLPQIPERCWRLICKRNGLPFPDAGTIAAGFWPWALVTPGLRLLICEGWKKALAAVSCGYAAIALPGVQMGRRVGPDGSERLIEALLLLNTSKRRWLIAFDADAKASTAGMVGAAAGALARALRREGGAVEIARLPLLPGTKKTGLDDLLVAAGIEALDRALATTGPRPVLPYLRPADRIAPAGQWLGEACPLPSPEDAPLVILQAPMGCGKTEAISQALAPLAADGVPILMPSHRRALGQAASERVGVPWCPSPGSDDRQQGVAACWDRWCPDSPLKISGYGWSGGVLVLDELAQTCEHLLLSTGTALGKRRRAAVLRTVADQLPRMRQTTAADAQMPEWAVVLLEKLTGRKALVIRSEHQPMKGRALHCPEGFKTPQAAAAGFRAKWTELVANGQPFLCWTSAQKAGMKNAPQTLAALHRLRNPEARILVIDSSTPEAAAELAADPDGVAERFDAIYCSPSISSGISFKRWKPAAVIAYSGGRIAPEHAVQALARVRCPEVPAYLFATERCPGAALRVGSGATTPDLLIRDLRAVADPLLGVLEEAGSPWLEAWAELGAVRNCQRFAYRATIAGLLEREGWELQADEPAACPVAAAQASADLGAIAKAAQLAEDVAVTLAERIPEAEAVALERRRNRTPQERAALQRHHLSLRWGLGIAAPSLELLEAERDGLRDGLQLGWLLSSREALALVPDHDRGQIAALDPMGRPFAPDRLRVALAPKVMAMQALGVAQLLERFAAGEVIAANDAAVITLHANATAHRGQLAAAAGISPAKLASGTLRAILRACGWELAQAGRIKTRGEGRDVLTYTAQPLGLPEGVSAGDLEAAWLLELKTAAAVGAFSSPIENFYRDEKCPSPPRPGLPPHQRPQLSARVASIPWATAPRSTVAPTLRAVSAPIGFGSPEGAKRSHPLPQLIEVPSMAIYGNIRG